MSNLLVVLHRILPKAQFRLGKALCCVLSGFLIISLPLCVIGEVIVVIVTYLIMGSYTPKYNLLLYCTIPARVLQVLWTEDYKKELTNVVCAIQNTQLHSPIEINYWTICSACYTNSIIFLWIRCYVQSKPGYSWTVILLLIFLVVGSLQLSHNHRYGDVVDLSCQCLVARHALNFNVVSSNIVSSIPLVVRYTYVLHSEEDVIWSYW